MINTWQGLKNSLFEKKENKSANRLKLYLSPYDVPNAVRALDEGNGNKLSIEFRYINVDESTELIKHNHQSNIDFEVGAVTGRVYKVIFNSVPATREVELEICIEEVETAFDRLADNSNRFSEHKYDAAREAAKYYLSSYAMPM